MIEKRKLKGGRSVYRVRWRDGGRGSRQNSRVFDRKEDALRFESELRRRKQLGELVESAAGRQTLDEWAREWFRTYAKPHLARTTVVYYARAWDRYVLPRLGAYELRRITPAVVARFADELRRDGVGEPTVRKVLVMLQGILRRAVVVGAIASNPVVPIRKPAQRRLRPVRPLIPEAIERLRSQMGNERDRTLVSVLAYAGLRPGEALALTWGCIGERTILAEQALALGEVKETKTGATRSVRLLAPLAADLKALNLKAGRPDADAFVFARRDGRPWEAAGWKNWRRRVFDPAAKAAGLSRIRPYDLRHSFVSLLIAEGRSIVDVARQAGHAPTMSLNTYAHVFDELEGAEKKSAEELIRAARVPSVLPRADSVASEANKKARFTGPS